MRKQYKLNFLTLFGCFLLSAISLNAQIFFGDTTKIQFIPAQIPAEVSWSPSVSLTSSGLFLEKLLPNNSAEVWVQSQPISVGMSWRPPTSAKVRLEIENGAQNFTHLNAYFRYSCDRVHWSTWYDLELIKDQTKITGTVFQGGLSIPRMAHEKYYSKMREWWKTKPTWSSDEHELSVWIVNQEPDFFSRELPFIGYIQVRIEGETQSMQLKSLTAKVSSAVGGLSAISKGPVRATTGEKWFFDVSKIKK